VLRPVEGAAFLQAPHRAASEIAGD